MKACHRCQCEIVLTDRVGRRDACPGCEADLRCCFNCAFYDPHYADACREPNADPVRDKDLSNFCEYFTFRDYEEQPRSTTAADARAQLEALFKKKPSQE